MGGNFIALYKTGHRTYCYGYYQPLATPSFLNTHTYTHTHLYTIQFWCHNWHDSIKSTPSPVAHALLSFQVYLLLRPFRPHPQQPWYSSIVEITSLSFYKWLIITFWLLKRTGTPKWLQWSGSKVPFCNRLTCGVQICTLSHTSGHFCLLILQDVSLEH